MSLEKYNQKRDFKKTAEPEGIEESSEDKLRFVVQRHSASHLHYDFRLEMEGVLKSWAVPKGPSLNPKDKRLAMMVEDHPFSYRSFEGSIPEGEYGGGEVEIWDEGWYEPLNKIEDKSDDLLIRAELHKQSLKFVMHGKKLKGEFALVKIKNSGDEKSWLLIKHNDQFAVKEDYDSEDFTDPESKVTARESKRKTKDIAEKTTKSFRNYAPALSGEKKLGDFIVPMMAQSAEKAFSSKDWVFEIKWDGYRAVADLRNDSVKLYSRNGLDFSQKFKKITNSLKLQQHEMILDGEIVAYDDQGKPNFQWLQQVGEKPNLVLVYQVFDILWLNGHSTETLTLLERKELLKDALIQNEWIKYCDHVAEKGEEFFKMAEDMGLEGMIAKKADSQYHEGSRSGDWLKIKFNQTEEAIVCGFSEPKGSRKKIGSLILGKYDESGKLVFAGQVGSGFTDKTLKEVHDKLEPDITTTCPFEKVPKTTTAPTWVNPKYVAEIKFSEITKDGQFRHPVFLHLRDDKTPEDMKPQDEKKQTEAKESKSKLPDVVKIEKKEPTERDNENKLNIGDQTVKLTNQNKIYFPKQGITKGDVVAYYRSVADFILPHIHDRPQSMNRFPNGIEGMSFYQKDASEDTPSWVKTEKIFSESNGKDINYIVCNDEATLVYLANLGCIEMNVWTARVQAITTPDYLVLDLDPSDNNTFEDVIETALTVNKLLKKAGVEGYPKTSGSSGIHIYIPMGAAYTFEQVKNFAHVLMQMAQQELPDITTLERSLQKRDKGKIYLDYLQNRHGQTLASVYSLRPKNGAPVSMPLEWKEVKHGLKPTDWNIENALERIKRNGDIFKPVLTETTDILKAIEKLSG